ncbi:MAG: glycine--tRNA ligase [Planctomycetota bacterium]
MSDATQHVSMESLVSLCKRRGFVYPASEIYGGLNGFWDYGPLGVQLKNNIRDSWWKCTVESPPIGPDGRPVSIVGLDSSIIQNPKTWVASGHVGGFSDPMVDDRETKQRYRADHVKVYVPRDGQGNAFAFMPGDEAEAQKKIKRGAKRNPDDYDVLNLTSLALDQYGNIVAPSTKEAGTLTEPREFNLMFMTYVGALADEDSKAYLRPETAQGIFLNYKNVLDTMRVKVPFGIAQIGKSFRNEVTPRNFIFRSREFEQMEMEWFCHEAETQKWYDFWKDERMKWWRSLGVTGDKLRFRDHEKDELSHYAKNGVGTVDIEYQYPFTAPDYGELEGIAHRSNFDLSAHQEHSGQNMKYHDEATKEKFIPHVIEPASGLTRAVLVVLCEAYREEEVDGVGGDKRTVLKFAPHLAPTKVAVFPLVKKDGMPEKATAIYDDLRTEMTATYDAGGAVGRRYRRQDEVGTPFCVTVDGDTISQDTVTVRDRDSMQQEKVNTSRLKTYLRDKLAAGV